MMFPRVAPRAALAVAVILAGVGAAATAAARQGDARLDALFRQLAGASSDAAAEAVEEQIWAIWLDDPRREVMRLMRAGIESMRKDELTGAVGLFDRVVALAPDYAEGWNKRANAHYLQGDYAAAAADIRRTLMLEPRHFAALAGLGLVYLELDEPAHALKALEAALAINPHMDGVREQVDELRRQLAGSAL